MFRRAFQFSLVLLALMYSCFGLPNPLSRGMTEPGLGRTLPHSPGISLGESEMQGTFIHIVFFWLKDGSDQAAVDKLIQECKHFLQPISTVRRFSVGKAAGTPREVVDNSFGVALVIHFDGKQGHDLYQQDPKHLEFIKRNQSGWERVQVYDVVAE